MIPEIGQFAMIIALCLAIVQSVFPIAGAAMNIKPWMALARPVAQGQFVFLVIAYVCLTYAFVVNDFSVLYVASHSNSALPIEYRIAGVWGGHEGSLLLWVCMLSLWTLAVTLFSRHLSEEMVSRVIGVLGMITIGFLLFMLLTSNPFDRLLPAAPDGRDLNPLLQDPGLIIHPPMLYMGYVGFSVVFAFAIAALLSGKLDAAWARWSRPWATIAWVFLSGGIALGSWWAYYELGWGGWWFWDPVENASFMPWLVGTALLHSLAVTEKRGGFKSWTVLLAIIAFTLSLLGTFLVRSGVITSVHAFATDPTRGSFILGFLVVVVTASLLLYAWRAPKVGLGGKFDLISKETMLLVNNVILTVAASAVLLGTVYPIIVDGLASMGLIEATSKVSVGAPYFNAIFIPLMIPLIFMMGIGPMSRWKKADLPGLFVRLKWGIATAIGVAVIVPFLMGEWSTWAAIGVLLAMWILVTVIQGIGARLQSGGDKPLAARIRAIPAGYYGMHIAHLGMAVTIMGIAMVTQYETETDVRMHIGDVVTVDDYVFRFDGVIQVDGPNYRADQGMIMVLKDGRELLTLMPEKRIYTVQTMPMTEAAIDTNIWRDLYVSLGEPVGNGAWIVRVYYKPFVVWIWAGTIFMSIGGLLAVADRRYRMLAKKAAKKKMAQATPNDTAKTATEKA